jgi:hypothetical protein
MPTREYAELVSVITETIEQMLPADPMIQPDADQIPDAASAAKALALAYLFDFEKIVWHYPDAAARLIEE